jgi:valyl-tRNA synthetase
MRTITLLLAPVIPFVAEHIWLQLYAESKAGSIHSEEFPIADKPDKATKKMLELGAVLTEFNSKVWNAKKEKGMSLRDPIDIEIPKELKPFEHDLKLMHNLGKVAVESKAAETKPETKEAKGKEREREKPKEVKEKPAEEKKKKEKATKKSRKVERKKIVARVKFEKLKRKKEKKPKAKPKRKA